MKQMWSCTTMLRDLALRSAIWIIFEYLMIGFFLETVDSLVSQQTAQVFLNHQTLMRFGNCYPTIQLRCTNPTAIGRSILNQLGMPIAIIYTVQMMFTARNGANMEIHLPHPSCENDLPMKQSISLSHTMTLWRKQIDLPHTIALTRD